MRAAKLRQHAQKRERVDAIIAAMADTGEDLTKSEIARRANVSRNYIAQHFTEQIEVARARAAQRFLAGSQAGARLSVASLRAELATTRDTARRLQTENDALKRRLGRLIGEEIAQRDPALAATTEHETLKRQLEERTAKVAEVQLALRDRDEELRAAQSVNRELTLRLNGAGRAGKAP
jgi:chromosome segregation ATPase